MITSIWGGGAGELQIGFAGKRNNRFAKISHFSRKKMFCENFRIFCFSFACEKCDFIRKILLPSVSRKNGKISEKITKWEIFAKIFLWIFFEKFRFIYAFFASFVFAKFRVKVCEMPTKIFAFFLQNISFTANPSYRANHII